MKQNRRREHRRKRHLERAKADNRLINAGWRKLVNGLWVHDLHPEPCVKYWAESRAKLYEYIQETDYGYAMRVRHTLEEE